MKKQKRLADIDKQYQAQVAVINKLKATPEGLALADPVKNPLVYPQKNKQKEALKNIEISFNNKKFLSILLKDGVKSYLGNVVNEAVKENIVSGWQIVLFSALHNRLADQVLAMHTQIEDAKKNWLPFSNHAKKQRERKSR